MGLEAGLIPGEMQILTYGSNTVTAAGIVTGPPTPPAGKRTHLVGLDISGRTVSQTGDWFRVIISALEGGDTLFYVMDLQNTGVGGDPGNRFYLTDILPVGTCLQGLVANPISVNLAIEGNPAGAGTWVNVGVTFHYFEA